MKATGIVRRIDDLGRVVIPKEIRRTFRIKEGDPLEIFVGSGEIVFKKHSLMGELEDIVINYADSLQKELNLPVAICDFEQVIASSGIDKKEIKNASPGEELSLLIKSRASYASKPDTKFYPLNDFEKSAILVMPIISLNDILGGIIVFSANEHTEPTDTELKLSKLTADLIAKQVEV